MAIEDKIFEFGASIVREAETRRTAINRLQMSGNYTPQYISDERQKAVAALQQEVKGWFDGLKAELKGKLAKIEAKYSQTPVGDASAQLLAFQRTQARLKAMSKDELAEKAQQYIADGTISSVDELDLLLTELRNRGMNDLADRVRIEAQERYFAYQPWKADAEYRQLEQDLQKANAYGANPNTVYVKAKGGVVEARPISDMLNLKTDELIGRW